MKLYKGIMQVYAQVKEGKTVIHLVSIRVLDMTDEKGACSRKDSSGGGRIVGRP